MDTSQESLFSIIILRLVNIQQWIVPHEHFKLSGKSKNLSHNRKCIFNRSIGLSTGTHSLLDTFTIESVNILQWFIADNRIDPVFKKMFLSINRSLFFIVSCMWQVMIFENYGQWNIILNFCRRRFLICFQSKAVRGKP